jgi:SnoaL-like domain
MARFDAALDRLEIRELIERYFHGIDWRDPDESTTCFTEDAHITTQTGAGRRGKTEDRGGAVAVPTSPARHRCLFGVYVARLPAPPLRPIVANMSYSDPEFGVEYGAEADVRFISVDDHVTEPRDV